MYMRFIIAIIDIYTMLFMKSRAIILTFLLSIAAADSEPHTRVISARCGDTEIGSYIRTWYATQTMLSFSDLYNFIERAVKLRHLPNIVLEQDISIMFLKDGSPYLCVINLSGAEQELSTGTDILGMDLTMLPGKPLRV